MENYLEPASDADKRYLPDNPKQAWGFDAEDLLSNISVGQGGRVSWQSSLKNLREKGTVTENFDVFLRMYDMKASDALQLLLASHDPFSERRPYRTGSITRVRNSRRI